MRGLLGGLALFSMLAFWPQGSAAQRTGAVVGLVNDADGQPLADVLVFVGDGTAATMTDELGLFGLFALPLEQHVLYYRKAGFEPRSFVLDLSTDVDYRDVGALVLTPGPEPTATLSGRVVEENGSGLAGAVVELNGRVVAETDSSGAFSVPGSPVTWGANELIVRHRAFADRTVTDRLWVVDANETFDLVVTMGIEPVPLPGVGVTVQSARLAAAGFYERREQLRSATFLTREQIDEMNPRRTEDLIRRALTGAGMSRTLRQSTAGVGGPQGGTDIPAQSFGRAQDGAPCLPVFFLDGLRTADVDTPAGLSSALDQLVVPEAIEGIEVYESVSGLPARYSPIGSVCGVILIWTR